eukprot:85675_1
MESLRSRIILHHTCLMEQLEWKYRNYINQLLVRKSKLVVKMQHDFYKELQRIRIHEYQSHTQTPVESNEAHHASTEPFDQTNISTNHIHHGEDTNQHAQPNDEVQNDISNEVSGARDDSAIYGSTYNPVRGEDTLNPIFTEPQAIQDDSSIKSDESLSELAFELDTSNAKPNVSVTSQTQGDQIFDFIERSNDTAAPSAMNSVHDEDILNPQSGKQYIGSLGVQGDKRESNQSIHKPTSKPTNSKLNKRKKRDGKKSFECPYCNASFPSCSLCTRHIRTHTNERPFKCTYLNCEKAFKRRDAFTRHIRTHTNERPFKCTYLNCDWAFKRRDALRSHIRTHTGEKPYQCNICKKRFTQSGGRTSHVKRMHAE